MKGKKETRTNNRNEALLDATARLFAEKGFATTSMRDIASAVGMLPGSIYYHYPSKDDLLLAIYETGVAQITTTFEAAIEDLDDPWQRLEAGMAAHIQAITDDSPFTSVIFRIRPSEVPRFESELVALRDTFEARFKTLIDDVPVRDGVDKHLLRLLILGAGNHAQMWFSPEGSRTAEEIGAAFSSLVREAVRPN